jgi:hypothetical protein
MEIEDKLIWKIQRWFRQEAPYLHRTIANGIKNLWRWFPLVWKDRDWDHHYIFEVLKFKIENTSKYVRLKDRYVGVERDSEIMMTCVRLIDKVQNEIYDGEWYEYVDQKMITEEVEEGEEGNIKLVKVDFEITSENFKSYFKKYPNVYKKALAASSGAERWPYTEISDQSLAMWMSHYNHKRAKRILFTLMERNIENWWD